MNKRLTTVVLTGALGLGGAATTFVIAPAVVSAATSEATTADPLGERVSRIKDALSGLVDDGTLTDAQADKVAETLADRMPGHDGFGHEGPGLLGHAGAAGHLADVAEVLGLSDDQLLAELREGRSLVDIAAEQDVTKQELVDRLVTLAGEHIDADVSDGRLSEEQAETLRSDLEARVTELVEREGFAGRHGGMGHRHGHGHAGGHGPFTGNLQVPSSEGEAAEPTVYA